ncbi:hypothetical protein ElyMa_003699500 [Elysia marginata]|uniref:Uncharacterized protein n=1 Tax=Elysia marginata TaxID=1093978 RepID=A0AAV4F421_9GAST|nr:hypothetical protein ElyMa_003699500 [Elysia marginata]
MGLLRHGRAPPKSPSLSQALTHSEIKSTNCFTYTNSAWMSLSSQFFDLHKSVWIGIKTTDGPTAYQDDVPVVLYSCKVLFLKSAPYETREICQILNPYLSGKLGQVLMALSIDLALRFGISSLVMSMQSCVKDAIK